MSRPLRIAVALAAAAILLALALAGSAHAAPIPVVQGIAATAVEPSGLHRQDVSVAWSLGANEYACSLTLSTPAQERTLALAPTQTSIAEQLAAVPGQEIRVVLSFVSVSPATLPENACFQARATTTATATAAAFQPPAPAPAPIEPVAALEPVAPSEPVAAEPTVDERLTALEQLLRELSEKLARINDANLAAWTALVDTLAAGATADVAALAARSAYLNATHDLG